MPRHLTKLVRRTTGLLGTHFVQATTNPWRRFRMDRHLNQPLDPCPEEYRIDVMQLEDRIMLSATPIGAIDIDNVVEEPVNHEKLELIDGSIDGSDAILSKDVLAGPDVTASIRSSDGIDANSRGGSIDPTAENDESIATLQPLTLAEGAIATIDNSLLEATDPNNMPTELVYTVLNGPESGTLYFNGAPATTFTQADIDAGLLAYEHNGDEVFGDSFGFQVDDGEGTATIRTFHIQITPVNDSPVLSDADVVFHDIAEDAGNPTGAVGTLVSDMIDVVDGDPTILRTDIVPFYAASSNIWERRSIGWWWSGWQDWAAKSKLALEKHGELWIHIPYGTLGAYPYDFAGKSHAAEGVPPYHGPLPHIAEGLGHYYEQILQPTDTITFYFGPPSQIYEEGMTYETFRGMVMYELSEIIALDAYADVNIGFDATYGQSTVHGGNWLVLGGEDGYIARVLLELDAMGIGVILEPWVEAGATWAYGFDTIATDWWMRTEGLDDGDTPVHSRWANRGDLTGMHYHLLASDSDIANYYGGDWENAVLQVMARGDMPLVLLKSYGLFNQAWNDYSNELIDSSTLEPYVYSSSYSSSVLLNSDDNTGIDFNILPPDVRFTTHSGPQADLELELPEGVPAPNPTPLAVVGNVADHDIDALGGIAVVGGNTEHGTWWYSTDDGATWNTLGTVSTSSALLLAADLDTRLYFEPNPDFHGTLTDGLLFHAWDQSDGTVEGTGGVHLSELGGSSPFSSATEMASITVTPVNDPPVNTVPGSQDIASNAALVFASSNSNRIEVTDIDGDLLTVMLTASGGTILLGNSGIISIVGGSDGSNHIVITGFESTINQALDGMHFLPATGHTGSANLQIQTDDGNGGIDVDAISISIDGTPTALNETYILEGDWSLIVAAPGILANDTDPEGHPLFAQWISGPSEGHLELHSDGSFSYVPTVGFMGIDTFRYRASDGISSSNVAVVTVIVSPNPQLPPNLDDGIDDDSGGGSSPGNEESTTTAGILQPGQDTMDSYAGDTGVAWQSTLDQIANAEGAMLSAATEYPASYRSDWRYEPIQAAIYEYVIPSLEPSMIGSTDPMPDAVPESSSNASSTDRLPILDLGMPEVTAVSDFSLEDLWTAFQTLGDQIEQERALQDFAVKSATLIGAAVTIGGILWVFKRGYLGAALTLLNPSIWSVPFSISGQDDRRQK